MAPAWRLYDNLGRCSRGASRSQTGLSRGVAGSTMVLEAIGEILQLTLSVAALYLLLRLYAWHREPSWSEQLDTRRSAIVSLLALAVAAVMVAEDALSGESHPIDHAMLMFIREHVPTTLTEAFDWITLTGSARVLTPLTLAMSAGLWVARRRAEARLVAGSVICAAALVYLVKVTVARERPALWDAHWYWGSSFPSGHTLVVAALATSVALIAARTWPGARIVALGAALAWVVLVGLSRLVLGVHWPTDVVVAGCLGAAIPLAFSLALEPLRA